MQTDTKMHVKFASLTCVYAFISQIGDGEHMEHGTGAHDLQLAPPSQPLSQATGTETDFCLLLSLQQSRNFTSK